MCETWKDNFGMFFRDMGQCPSGFSLDRKDVHGNYEPGNCRWIKLKSQSKNKQSTLWVQVRGKRVCFSAACRIMKVNMGTALAASKRLGSPEKGIAYCIENGFVPRPCSR